MCVYRQTICRRGSRRTTAGRRRSRARQTRRMATTCDCRRLDIGRQRLRQQRHQVEQEQDRRRIRLFGRRLQLIGILLPSATGKMRDNIIFVRLRNGVQADQQGLRDGLRARDEEDGEGSRRRRVRSHAQAGQFGTVSVQSRRSRKAKILPGHALSGTLVHCKNYDTVDDEY